jgi:hypothetical protein
VIGCFRKAATLPVFLVRFTKKTSRNLAPSHHHQSLLYHLEESTQSSTMAPSATNGDAMAGLEEIRAPPGVVLPPKEIKGASSTRAEEHQLTSPQPS